MPRIIFTPAARADLISALNWYETHAPHVAPQFRSALRATLARMAENPKQFLSNTGGRVELYCDASPTSWYFVRQKRAST